MADKPFFVIPLDLGTVTTGNELATRPATHLGEFFYRGMVWQSSGASNLWVRCDLGAAQEIDFVGLLHTNAGAGDTIRVRVGDSQAEVDGSADYDSGVVAFIDPAVTRDDGRYHSHTELPSTLTKRWVRIDVGSHSGDFQAAMLIIGKKLQGTRYYDNQWDRSVRDLGSITFGRNGVPGLARGDKLRAISFKLAWLTEAEMESLWSPIDEQVGKTSPIFLSFDPEASEYRQRRTFFGFMEETPMLRRAGHNRYEKSIQFLSLF